MIKVSLPVIKKSMMKTSKKSIGRVLRKSKHNRMKMDKKLKGRKKWMMRLRIPALKMEKMVKNNCNLIHKTLNKNSKKKLNNSPRKTPNPKKLNSFRNNVKNLRKIKNSHKPKNLHKPKQNYKSPNCHIFTQTVALMIKNHKIKIHMDSLTCIKLLSTNSQKLKSRPIEKEILTANKSSSTHQNKRRADKQTKRNKRISQS